jgi:hypothetical protein
MLETILTLLNVCGILLLGGVAVILLFIVAVTVVYCIKKLREVWKE